MGRPSNLEKKMITIVTDGAAGSRQVGNRPMRSMFSRCASPGKVSKLVITDLSIPVAAHLGPGTVGIVAYPVEEGING